jgi:hypothetical protein
MLYADTTINPGGLMRCEMETIDEYIGEHMAEHVPDKPLIIACHYCSGRPLNIILEDGVWRWNVATEE